MVSDTDPDGELLWRQLLFLADRRSLREMEELLQRFLASQRPLLNIDHCRCLIRLLQYDDSDLLSWISASQPIPDEWKSDSMGDELRDMVVCLRDHRSISPTTHQREL
ncbi:MAG: succinate dehydrogenase assembly factor 2 [Magnetococcales bacterium]|nr:succinate dehydrogenase assembly factor 2 [Magnetococcales bacterium]